MMLRSDEVLTGNLSDDGEIKLIRRHLATSRAPGVFSIIIDSEVLSMARLAIIIIVDKTYRKSYRPISAAPKMRYAHASGVT